MYSNCISSNFRWSKSWCRGVVVQHLAVPVFLAVQRLFQMRQ
jgi:hypothetical protein